MTRQILTQGEAFSIAFFHIKFPSEGRDGLSISKSDKLTFSIGRRNRAPEIERVFPNGMERAGESFFVFLTAEETARLPCLLYRMQLTVDIGGKGKEIYTLVDKELEVVAK